MINLSNESKLFLQSYYEGPLFYSFEPTELRTLLAETPVEEMELQPIGNTKEETIAVQDGEIKLRIYTPIGEGPFPVIVYYHGGGWVFGNLDSVHYTCHMLCQTTNSIVVSVDYRLAPEFKFPTPMNDAYEALCWVNQHIDHLNADKDKIIVAGDSAGGNLAAVMALRARDDHGPKIHAQLLIYPVTELSYSSQSYEEFKVDYFLDKDFMIWFGNHYINNDDDTRNPYVAPLHAKDLTNLPPAIIITAQCDVLRDEGIAYGNKLKESGIHVEQHTEDGLIHGFFTLLPLFENSAKQVMNKLDDFLKSL